MLLLRRSRDFLAQKGLGLAVASLLALSAAQAQEYRVGIFFDEAGQSCVGEIRNFGGDVRVYILAFAPAGTEVNGALVGLDLPSGIYLRQMVPPKDSGIAGDLTARSGLDVTLLRCPVASGPILLASLDLYQSDDGAGNGERVPDIELLLRGGVVEADSLSFTKAQIKICPEDPLGGDPTFEESLSYRATLNCTSDCPCETSVVAKTWGWVKRLFRGP
jgi:hypothetical protein